MLIDVALIATGLIGMLVAIFGIGVCLAMLVEIWSHR